MAKIVRKLQKLFASTGSAIGQFGSAQEGTKVLSTDLDTLQALNTRFLNGWNDATISGEKLPTLEEMNCLGYIFSQQIAYLLQEGIPEYLSTKEYHQNSFVKKAGTNEIYSSLTNTNTGNALTDTTKWQRLGNNPNFSAKLSANQVPTINTITKVQFDTENYDTGGYYDPTTNYRFTPLRAGKYLVNSLLNFVSDTSFEAELVIYKNGTQIQRVRHEISVSGQITLNISRIVQLNGTTDYIEIFALISAGTTFSFDDNQSEFSAFKLID